MTDQDPEYDGIPLRKRDQLAYSITNLIEKYGRATPLAATLINSAFILLGVAIWYLATGWVSFAGAVLAIWCAVAILKWVIQA